MPSDFLAAITKIHEEELPRGELITSTPDLIQGILALLFPIRAAKRCLSREDVESTFYSIQRELSHLLRLATNDRSKQESLAIELLRKLPEIRDLLLLDANAIVREDPAATSLDEVIICYPGFFAIGAYRIAHALVKLGVALFPRVISEFAHRETGIDIHPRATIGKSFFIDHGTGIVIGETAIIKDHVKMYQGVTLGGLTVHKGLANQKRHPTIEENVTIYANATILGGDTIIGANSIIGGNVWISASVPPNSKVYYPSDIPVDIPVIK